MAETTCLFGHIPVKQPCKIIGPFKLTYLIHVGKNPVKNYKIIASPY
jgi:hypothetical protein